MPDQRAALVRRAQRLLDEVRQLRLDADHWNRAHPGERPIIADPRGELARVERQATAILDAIKEAPHG
jgi:hypothetical protein